MATKTAVGMVLALTDYSEQVTVANYQERLQLNVILEIEADATILDTHLAARDRKMAEALKVCLQYIDDERDGNIATIRPRYEVRAAIREALPSEGDDEN